MNIRLLYDRIVARRIEEQETARNGIGMNKRLVKRHKRQVARAKQRVKVSEPDVRTPEQLAAAREASHAVSSLRNDARANYFTPSVNHAGRAEDTPAKVETGS